MALDVDHLRTGLETYRRSLEQQREQTRQQFNDLQQCFHALFSVYGGQMAEEFQHNWGRTSEWFSDYLAKSAKLDQFLGGRIDELKHL